MTHSSGRSLLIATFFWKNGIPEKRNGYNPRRRFRKDRPSEMPHSGVVVK